MGDSDRVEIGKAHRSAATAPRGVPILDAVPVLTDPDEVTSPVELLLRELTEEERQYRRELDEKLGAHTSIEAPATHGDLLKLAMAFASLKKEDRRARRKSADHTLEVLGEKGPPIERLSAVERKMRVVWALLAAAGTAAAGSLITVAKGLYERGADDGAARVRLERIEKDVERLERDVRMNRARLDYPVTKGTVSP